MGKYNRKDHLYKKAKDSGHLSRARYKLIELDRRFKLLRSGQRVLELGAWPGGWSQYVLDRIRENGLLVALDLKKVDEVIAHNFDFLTISVFDEDVSERLKGRCPGGYDLVLSDMAPKISGIRFADEAQMSQLAIQSLEIAAECLKPGGSICIKLFNNAEADTVVKAYRERFDKVTRAKLRSTRNSSSEFYLVGHGLRSAQQLRPEEEASRPA